MLDLKRKRFAKGIRRAAWLTLWVAVLSGPLIYYLEGRAGILAAAAVALMPLTATMAYSLWQAYHNRRPKSIVNVAAGSSALMVTAVTSVYLWNEQFSTSLAAAVISRDLLYFMIGVNLGLIAAILARLSRPQIWFALAAWEIYSSWRWKEFGIYSATIGISAAIGMHFGFILRKSIRGLWQDGRKLWKDMIVYQGEFATFIVGYLLIVYVFAGFFAMAWRLNSLALGPILKDSARFDDFVFFSLLTVSTLGYIDSKPITLIAKVLVSAEVLTGIFWLTVVFARLSVYAQERQHRRYGRNARSFIPPGAPETSSNHSKLSAPIPTVTPPVETPELDNPRL